MGPWCRPGAAFGLGLDEQEEPVSLGLKGSISDFEGGAEYRSVGKRFERLVNGPPSQRDREGTEVWVGAAAGPPAPAPVAVRPGRQRGPQPGAAPHHPRPDRDHRAGRRRGAGRSSG